MVARDGKTLRRSHDRGSGTAALHLMSAWASEARLVLAQRAVRAKVSEVGALPEVLALLALEGCIVTIDALGCHASIAQAIVAKEAEYVLALKDNQPRLCAEVQALFADAAAVAFREDESRVRQGQAAHNLALLGRIAVTLLQHEPTARCGLKAKRLKAGWDHRYLLQVLAS